MLKIVSSLHINEYISSGSLAGFVVLKIGIFCISRLNQFLRIILEFKSIHKNCLRIFYLLLNLLHLYQLSNASVIYVHENCVFIDLFHDNNFHGHHDKCPSEYIFCVVLNLLEALQTFTRPRDLSSYNDGYLFGKRSKIIETF